MLSSLSFNPVHPKLARGLFDNIANPNGHLPDSVSRKAGASTALSLQGEGGCHLCGTPNMRDDEEPFNEVAEIGNSVTTAASL